MWSLDVNRQFHSVKNKFAKDKHTNQFDMSILSDKDEEQEQTFQTQYLKQTFSKDSN